GPPQSSVAIVNTILPVLGGFFVDTFGTGAGSVLATTLVAAGNILVAISTNMRSFPVMVIGRVLYGLGSGSITVVQGAILSHWFRGRGLAITLGLEVAVSRLASFLSMATVMPIAIHTGFYGWAFWFTAFLCVLSCVVNAGYVLLLRYLRVELGLERRVLARKKAFHPSAILRFPMVYWWIVGVTFTLGSAWTTFLHLNTEMVKIRFGRKEDIAAFTASISQVLPIFIAPFQGYLHDRYGRRAVTAMWAALMFVLSMWLFLHYVDMNPLVGMIIFSVSLTFGPVAMFSSVSLVLSKAFVGTGLGIYKAALHIGTSLLDILVGVLQD
ncbi:major facilitator superfamily domain-containing protein, partial [Thamnocephalis sphaerospora]